jgi:peptidoglycan/LPS O-acetylase OafA/YrhL
MPTSEAERVAPGTSFGHLPALDGIRAFAVASVVLFHAGVGGVRGGLLGVDTFFVLSGFLITALLLTEHGRNGRIDLPAFWVRRARRLLPALLTVLVATVLTGRFLLDNDDLGLLRTDALAALAYVANWRMIIRGTGYVAATAAPSPLQHTWSLGIEEQFYLLWPLALTGLLAWRPDRCARWALMACCTAGTLTSAVLCARFYAPDSISRAYYGTDTRAQALLIGAGLAALLWPAVTDPVRRHRAGSRFTATGLLGAAGVGTTLWLWHVASDDASWLYRGGLTIAALATAAVVALVVLHPRSGIARFLASAPLAGAGRISYGIYLWHWPLFSYVTAEATGLSRWLLLTVRLAGTLLLAMLSYHLIEQPIRHGLLGRRLPRRVPIAVTTGALALTAVTITLATAPPPAPSTMAAPVIVATGRAGASAPVRRPNRVSRAAGREPRVTFFGDSVAWTIGTYLPPHPGIWTSVRAIEGCGIATLPQILELGTPHTNYPGCTRWPDRWRGGVVKDDPDVAVIELNRWELMDRKLNGIYQHVGEPQYDAYLLGRIDEAVGIAGSRGAAVVLLTAAYTHRAEKPDGSLYPEDQPSRVDAWNTLLYREAARRPGKVTVLNLTPVVCPGGRFTWMIGHVRVRSDGLHYTPAGVQKIIAPWLLPKLAAIANGTYQPPPGRPPSG